MLEARSSDNQDVAGALFRDGKLSPAIDACSTKLRAMPNDLGARLLLAELLLLVGNLDRADTVLDAAPRIQPEVAVTVAEFRQLLRAETARRQLDSTGRMPEFLGEPTPALRALLAARVAQRAVDDLCSGVFEILTTTGKYYWIPTERVASIELVVPRRPRDLAWRRANVSVLEGPDGTVYLPALYANDDPDLADTFRLGRATEWREQDGSGAESLVRGVGLRTFLAGDEAYDIMGLTTLSFAA
jgi:type VI secretion system protein ImpE